MDLIITHTQFSRAAFLRAGVRTPVHVVPVPIQPDYLAVPDWRPEQRTTIDCPCYVFPQPASLPRLRAPGPTRIPAICPHASVSASCIRNASRPCRSGSARPCTAPLAPSAPPYGRPAKRSRKTTCACCIRPDPNLELSGVVYTAILNPFDARKNWQDLLSGFLLALKDRDDATLVVKLVVSAEWEAEALGEMFAFYRASGLSHRCKLVFVTAYLSDEQLVELTRASTYYLNTSRAEGSCLPLQSFMAAGRPALAPPHTGMADSIDDQCGFTLASHPEPAAWPQEVDGGYRTTWHRLVWQSLHDQLRASYETAKNNTIHYQTKAERCREHMRQLVGVESVASLLAAALDEGMAIHRHRSAPPRDASRSVCARRSESGVHGDFL